MRRWRQFASIAALLLGAPSLFACGLRGAVRQGWALPSDAKLVRSTTDAGTFEDPGLPSGVKAIAITYKRSGFRFAPPDGQEGTWELREVKKLYYQGKQFAVVGDAYYISPAGNFAGCYAPTAIYDQHCSGRFDTIETVDSVLSMPPKPRYHLPSCFAGKGQ